MAAAALAMPMPLSQRIGQKELATASTVMAKASTPIPLRLGADCWLVAACGSPGALRQWQLRSQIQHANPRLWPGESRLPGASMVSVRAPN